jgi:transposase
MPIQPRILRLHRKTEERLISLKREAEQDGEYRVAMRIHAVLLNHQGKTSSEIAKILHTSRSSASQWLKNYETHGYDSLLEGQRSGRQSQLSEEHLVSLGDIIDAGPIAYGFSSAVWSSIMIVQVIQDEFSVDYHPGHVRKLLKRMDYSMQKPKRVLVQASEAQKNRWRRYIYPNIKKSSCFRGCPDL